MTTTQAGPGRRDGHRIRSIAIWSVVALVGAVCWSVLALSRGEEVSADRPDGRGLS